MYLQLVLGLKWHLVQFVGFQPYKWCRFSTTYTLRKHKPINRALLSVRLCVLARVLIIISPIFSKSLNWKDNSTDSDTKTSSKDPNELRSEIKSTNEWFYSKRATDCNEHDVFKCLFTCKHLLRWKKTPLELKEVNVLKIPIWFEHEQF